jgi:hypothetical protein
MKYKYQGKTETNLVGYGIVQPGETIETELKINNPLFREIKTKKEKK